MENYNLPVNSKTMELKVIRKEFAKDYTVGELYINDEFFCYTMEDTDRNLTEEDPLSKLKKIKIAKRTAIPYGDYRVMLSFSKKLKRFLPLLLDVPNCRGIRIHKGSTQDWSSGCILVGLEKTTAKLKKIVEAENKLMEVLKSVNEIEPIYIKIVKDGM